MRSNQYKQSILDVFKGKHLLSLKEIHAGVPDAHFVSVYRNVDLLCSEGVLKKIVVDKNKVVYEMATHDHGHFVCNTCDDVTAVAVPAGFTTIDAGSVSEVLVRGTCKECV